MALLEIRNLRRQFGDYVAVDDLTLSIEAGEFFTLLGPSGCGKTTLLRMIAGFDAPDQGEIILDGGNVVGLAPERRPVCTVFQNYALFPHMTVEQNIAFPLRMARDTREKIRSKVQEALEDVRLAGFGKRMPHELSGGQRQRVAVARALVSHPKLLLLDEPLSALDAKLREQMQIELINLQKEVGITFIYVTHDQEEALALSHRIAVMNHGKVEQLDEPSLIYSQPRTRFVADFIGTCNLFDGTVSGQNQIEVAELGAVQLALPEGLAAGADVTLALRPEKIAIVAADSGDAMRGAYNIADTSLNSFTGHVSELLFLGDVTVYIVTTDSGCRIEALLANSALGRTKFFEVGDAVRIAWHPFAGHVIHG